MSPFSKAYGPTLSCRRLFAHDSCVSFYLRQSCAPAIVWDVFAIVAVTTVWSAYTRLVLRRSGHERDISCWVAAAAARESDVLYYSPLKTRGSNGASLHGNRPVIVVVGTATTVLAAGDFSELFISDAGRGTGKPATGYGRREKLPRWR